MVATQVQNRTGQYLDFTTSTCFPHLKSPGTSTLMACLKQRTYCPNKDSNWDWWYPSTREEQNQVERKRNDNSVFVDTSSKTTLELCCILWPKTLLTPFWMQRWRLSCFFLDMLGAIPHPQIAVDKLHWFWGLLFAYLMNDHLNRSIHHGVDW